MVFTDDSVLVGKAKVVYRFINHTHSTAAQVLQDAIV
jgi:hypothetical protein